MMTNSEIMERITGIADQDPRYRRDAFLFILVALEFTLSKLAVRRHLTGQELSKGIAEFARQQYGFLAKTVLESWNITVTRDFGEIVYLLIEHGLLSKTDEDSIDDFDDVFDFEEEFSWDMMTFPDISSRF